MQKPFAAAQPQIKSSTRFGARSGARRRRPAREPALGSFIYATILTSRGSRMPSAIAWRSGSSIQLDAGCCTRPSIRCWPRSRARRHVPRRSLAVAKRDPACRRLIEPLLYFKGFHALETHRFSHALWQAGR